MPTNKFKFDKFSDFYLFYLTQHRNPTCRLFHAIGTSLVIVSLFHVLYTGHWERILLLPIFGYGFSWIGHFGFERNKPAAFRHPFYSLASDFVMNWHIWTGQLRKYIARSESQAGLWEKENL
ncbi:Mpo1-like protein [Leptospira sp. 'Mane']|uniref:Mpo1-like protein n=1 Tax=Leptospira sp. 'Mane' TaxID=3387407 RepID=UPI00398A55D5